MPSEKKCFQVFAGRGANWKFLVFCLSCLLYSGLMLILTVGLFGIPLLPTAILGLTVWFSILFFGLQFRGLRKLGWSRYLLLLWSFFPGGPVLLQFAMLYTKEDPNADDEESPANFVPFWKDPLYGLALLAVLPLIFAQLTVFLPVKVTEETHFVTRSLAEDGSVDYFQAAMEPYEKELKDPENGARIIAEALGSSLFQITWPEEKEFSPNWLAVCETFRLDPNLEPEFSIRELRDIFEGSYPDGDILDEEPATLLKEWTLRNDALLDRIAEAAEKPFLTFPCAEWKRSSYWFPFSLHQNLGNLSDAFACRTKLSLKAGDSEKAVRDILTLFRLSRKLRLVPAYALGSAPWREENAQHCLHEAILSDSVSLEQLERIRMELERLPAKPEFQVHVRINFLQHYWLIQKFLHDPVKFQEEEDGRTVSLPARYFPGKFPHIDENAFRKTVSQQIVPLWEIAQIQDPLCRAEKLKELEETIYSEYGFLSSDRSTFWETFTANGRGESAAHQFDWIFTTISTFNQLAIQLEAEERLMRLALEIGIFQRKNARWPKELAELGLPSEYLTDPFTGKQTLTYRRNEEKEDSGKFPWVLYSWGRNRTDEGGKACILYEEGPVGGEESFTDGEMAEDTENDFPQWKEENTGDVVWGAEDPL